MILDSISNTVIQEITNQEDSTTVGSPPVRFRNLICKLIVNKQIIDTIVISGAFRVDLSRLGIFMATYNSKIDVLNTCSSWHR